MYLVEISIKRFWKMDFAIKERSAFSRSEFSSVNATRSAMDRANVISSFCHSRGSPMCSCDIIPNMRSPMRTGISIIDRIPKGFK